ncbi:hypothetical protein EZV62_009633 [Acer yangbiense]|uniref:Uncharacterized protein n=1 Tax=Acer yangbiense TaxID=1000413 RepID=A0A5C7I0U4_9ROSI|nr:hypothetical protein EZV62_009633 [Acer yangbiense]
MQPQTIAGHGVDDGQLVSNSFFQYDTIRRGRPATRSDWRRRRGEKTRNQRRRSSEKKSERRRRGLVAGRRQFQRLRSLSAVSLISMFLQPGLLGFLIFIPWTFLPIIVAYQIHYVLIHHACRCLQQKIKNLVSKFSDICNNSFGFNGSSLNEQPRLPV